MLIHANPSRRTSLSPPRLTRTKLLVPSLTSMHPHGYFTQHSKAAVTAGASSSQPFGSDEMKPARKVVEWMEDLYSDDYGADSESELRGDRQGKRKAKKTKEEGEASEEFGGS